VIVIDTSAVVDALVGRDRSAELVARMSGEGSLHAPHLLDTEFVAALRGLANRRAISADRAADALLDFDRLRITRYAAQPLVTAIWELRGRVTAYDATFVALAATLECPLVTCDRALGRARLGIEVQVF
jgi:predicted nucleic acid-binding protein